MKLSVTEQSIARRIKRKSTRKEGQRVKYRNLILAEITKSNQTNIIKSVEDRKKLVDV